MGFSCFFNSPKTPKSNANARAAQLLTQIGQIGAYVLRSAFSVGVPKLIRQTQIVQIGALILCTAFLDIGGNCAERIAKIPTSQNPKMSLLHASISPENFLR